jgi:transposase-like protein
MPKGFVSNPSSRKKASKAVPKRCPDPACDKGYHLNPVKGFCVKRGTYKSNSGKVIQRWKCACGKTFTSHSECNESRQRKDINRALFGLVCSGITIRRAAQILGVAVNTIRNRIAWLADKAREAHAAAHANGSLETSFAQFDEMETFIHSRCQPATIAMVVRHKTGQILSIKTAIIVAKGHLAKKGAAQGWIDNHGPIARAIALSEAAKSIQPGATIACDGWPTYPTEIASYVGKGVQVTAYISGSGVGYDPMFRLNHTCAKIRADIACMARDTWTTTKKIVHLQDRLDIYVAWNNQYQLL